MDETNVFDTSREILVIWVTGKRVRVALCNGHNFWTVDVGKISQRCLE